VAGAPVSNDHTINHPHVVVPEQGITETSIYRATTRLPQPPLYSGMGRPTPADIRVGYGAGGDLESTFDANGNRVYQVRMNARPVER
jgi:hypothetical protein